MTEQRPPIYHIVVNDQIVGRGWWRRPDGTYIGATEAAIAWALAGHHVEIVNAETGEVDMTLEPIRPH